MYCRPEPINDIKFFVIFVKIRVRIISIENTSYVVLLTSALNRPFRKRSSPMANNEALFSAVFTPTYRLPNTIAAIQACCARHGAPELGAISHLPEGAELEFCGDGFNEGTLKVRWEGQSYFVFMQDIAPLEAAVESPISDPLNGTLRKPMKTQLVKSLGASQVA
jgi:hypothetical protein